MHTKIGTVPFAANLRRHGDRVALISGTESLTYAQLADRVESAQLAMGGTRRLLWLGMRNDLDSVVAYLAALAAGQPALVTGPCHSALAEHYRANAWLDRGALVGRDAYQHELHSELALLLSTSGSTGSPKLVRLSQENLQANAESIAEYLGLQATDVGITSLPLHYCYGLSVLHSHLLVGAALVLTDASVLDDDFWTLMRSHRVTNLAGVPHTFELLDRVGFADLDLPALRFVTQAGGRLPVQRVRQFVELGQQLGFDLFVMYGQTEATARMSYLPPDLTSAYPHTVGIAIPGGEFRLANEHDGVGELVYRGRNIMLGYAHSPADLALGREISELHTGDLARITDSGLVEIVGRSARFAKIFGLRIDLDAVERALADDGFAAAVTEGSAGLLVAATATDSSSIADSVLRVTGLPLSAVEIVQVRAIPRTAAGKVDYPALRASQQPVGTPLTSVAQVYATVLGKPESAITPDSTFVSLGGDSLSYVAASCHLERLLGKVPDHWQLRTVSSLDPLVAPDRTPSAFRSMETTLVLRALAIVAVVGSHIGVFDIRGGAHLLLAIAGFNFARFQLNTGDRRERWHRMVASWRRIVGPSVVWIAAVVVIGSEYGWATLLGTNLFGPADSSPEWRYWYIETIVYLLLAVALLFLSPRVHTWERANPYRFALMLVSLGLLLRFTLVADSGPASLYTPVAVFWFFAVGWALATAPTTPHRLLPLAMLTVGLPGYFADGWRTAAVAVGIVLLAFVPQLRVPALIVPAISTVASASLFIYLTHWQTYPPLAEQPWLALAVSVALGIAVERVWRWLGDPKQWQVPAMTRVPFLLAK